MKLFIQQQGQGLPLILLHGWGFNGRIWDSIVATLSPHWHIYQVDLPGHGRSALSSYQLGELTAQLAAQLPKQAFWVGWSLGGLLAMAMAHHYSSWVRGLALISSSPRFVSAPDWPYALAPTVLDTFSQQLEQDADKTWRSFLALQLRGLSVAQRRYVYTQLEHGGYPQPQALQAGLNCLLATDLRPQLTELSCPTWLCLGEQDPLIPAQIGHLCHSFWPHVQHVSIPAAAHIPFLSHPEVVVPLLQQFLMVNA